MSTPITASNSKTYSKLSTGIKEFSPRRFFFSLFPIGAVPLLLKICERLIARGVLRRLAFAPLRVQLEKVRPVARPGCFHGGDGPFGLSRVPRQPPAFGAFPRIGIPPNRITEAVSEHGFERRFEKRCCARAAFGTKTNQRIARQKARRFARRGRNALIGRIRRRKFQAFFPTDFRNVQ